MLKQLHQLTVDADGRYATEEELAFLREYISSAKTRTKIYKKLREMRSDIALQTEQKVLEGNEDIFVVNGKDYKPMFHRDQGIDLRYTAATVLSGDLERLKQSLLLWYKTILKAARPNKVKTWTEMTYRVKPSIVLSTLDEEEHNYIAPILSLKKSVLGSF